MLLLLIDSCDLFVRESSLTFVKRRGWFKPKTILLQTIPINIDASLEVIIYQISSQLKKPEWHCRTNIILAGNYVKFRLFKNDSRLDYAESMALLKHQFLEAYEKKVTGWSIFLAKPSFDKSNIACMVNQSILTQLQLTFKSAGVKIKTAEPSLVTWLNKVRKQLPQDGWVAIVDIEVVYALKLLKGEMTHLRELPLVPNLVKSSNEVIEKMLAREMMALGDDINTAKVSCYWVDQGALQPIFLKNNQVEVLSRHAAQNINVAAV